MGYMGFGTQRWISTMKPKKFLGKRSKPDGGGVSPVQNNGIQDYYHYKKHELTDRQKRKYSLRYKTILNQRLKKENQKKNLYSVLSFILIIALLIVLFFYLNVKFGWL